MTFDLIIDFLLFAFTINVISYGFMFAVMFFRIATLSESQYQSLLDFVKTRRHIIMDCNSPLKRMAYFVAVLGIPGYGLGMNLIQMYYALGYDGSQGLIGGIIKADRYSAIELVSYDIIDLDEKD